MSLDASTPLDAGAESQPRVATAVFVPCALACVALTVAVGLQAPAVSVGVRWTPARRSRALRPISLKLDGVTEPARDRPPRERGRSGVAWAFGVLVAVAVLLGVAWWLRRAARRGPPVNAARTRGEAGALGAADARVLQTGLAAALELLAADDREARDAVVQAWQGLQDAAAAAGVHRRPAETASEFTARILYRSRGSAAPIARLLALYERVRFGGHAPDADEITAARDALGVLVDLWRADLPGRRPRTGAR